MISANFRPGISPNGAWRNAMMTSLRSIERHGLLTPQTAKKKGVTLLRYEGTEKVDELFGRCLFSKCHFSESRLQGFPLSFFSYGNNLKECLYDSGCGVLDIMTRRPDNRPCPSEWRGHGVVFAADSNNLLCRKKEPFGEVRVLRSIRWDEISQVFVPEYLWETAEEALREHSNKIVPVPFKKPANGGDLDYEGKLRELMEQNPRAVYWIHGMRLPIPDET